MDNLTHSLVGIFAAAPFCRNAHRSLRGALLAASVLGSNLADADLLYVRITEWPLGTLLHHRGHTHTFAFVPLGLILLLATIWGVCRLTRQSFSRREWGQIALLGTLGLVLHVALDTLNSYGVHPFWPIANHWIYGDTLFIIEPTIWLLLLLFLLRCSDTPILKAGVTLLLTAAFLLMWYSGYVPQLNLIILGVATLALGFIFFQLSATSVWALCLVFMLLVGCTFARMRQEVKQVVRSLLEGSGTDLKMYDIVATPYPANPFCWTTIAVSAQGKNYELKRGIVTTGLMECTHYEQIPVTISSPIRPEQQRQGQVLWQSSFSAPLAELAELDAHDCRLSAYLRFARAPFYLLTPNELQAGDLRFQRGTSRFGLMVRNRASKECPSFVPPWDKPTEALLRAGH